MVKILNKFIFLKYKMNWYSSHDFFFQTLKVITRGNKYSFFRELTNNKKVLHFGCADSPIFDVNYNFCSIIELTFYLFSCLINFAH